MKRAQFDQVGLPTAYYDPEWEYTHLPEGLVEITDEQWQELIGNVGLRRWDGKAVVAYQRPYEPPPQVTTVSASQAKIALLQASVLDSVEAKVAAHPYRPVRIWYESANMWDRGHPYVTALGYELGLSDANMDDLFTAASKL